MLRASTATKIIVPSSTHEMTIEYDDFYGDQSSELAADSDDGDPIDPFGNVAIHEFRSLESSIQTLSYLDGYDETKELKLQEGFSKGYRQSFHDAFRVGRCLGSLCATAAKDELLAPGAVHKENSGARNLDQSAVTKAINDPVVLIKRFLEEEILIGSNKCNDAKYNQALMQLENLLGRFH